MRRIRRLWDGDLPLASAFWNWAVMGGLAVNVTTSLLFLVLIAADRPIPALIVGYVFSVPYNVVATVGVWRAAGRHDGDPKWAAAARIVTLVGMIALSLT